MIVFRKPAGRGKVGSGVVKDGDSMFLSNAHPIVPVDLPERLVAVQEKEHRGARVDCLFELGECFNPDELRTRQEHLRLVAALVGLLNDDFVPEPLVSGSWSIASGFSRTMQAAVATVMAEAAPAVTIAAGTLSSAAILAADFFLELGDRDEPPGRLCHRLHDLGGMSEPPSVV